MGCRPVADKQIHPIQVKFSAEMLARVKAEAEKMGVPVTTWIKVIVSKHLEGK